MYESERYFINLYKSNNPNFGYNITSGGNGRPGVPLSEETKRKISQSLTGRKLPEDVVAKMKGRQLSQDTINKITAKTRGQKRSDETRRRISYAVHKNHSSPEYREKLAIAKITKGVMCVETGEIFRSLVKAGEAVGRNKSSIWEVVNNPNRQSAGFHWVYVDKENVMRQGFMLNPDSVFVSNLRKRIKQNNKYCPNKAERVPDNKCPCREFRENGSCDCGLYIKDPTYIIADEVRIDRESQEEGWV